MFVNFMKPMMALFLITSGWRPVQAGNNTSTALGSNSDVLPTVKNEALTVPVTGQSVSGSGGAADNGDEIDSDDRNSRSMSSVTGYDINTSTSSEGSDNVISEEVEEGSVQVSPKLEDPAEPEGQTMAGEYIELYREHKDEVSTSELACVLLSSRGAEEAAALINLLDPFKKEHVIDLSYILSAAIEKFNVECIPAGLKELVNKLYLEMALEHIPNDNNLFSEEDVIRMQLGGIYLKTHADQ